MAAGTCASAHAASLAPPAMSEWIHGHGSKGSRLSPRLLSTRNAMNTMNPSTTILQGTRTITFGGHEANRCPTDLYDRYEQLLEGQHLGWTEHLRFRRLLGTGGQGVV